MSTSLRVRLIYLVLNPDLDVMHPVLNDKSGTNVKKRTDWLCDLQMANIYRVAYLVRSTGKGAVSL